MNASNSYHLSDWPIIGHKNVVKFLKKSIINNKLAHAYLFCGLEHLGKKTVAEHFAVSLFNSINVSQAINIHDLEKHPDFYRIKKKENKKNISIEQIRKLRESLSLHSFIGSYKIALIEEAQLLTEEANNALLKTLEEPTKETVIVLLVTNLNTLPKTIVSRCQIIRFLPVSKKEILKFSTFQKKISDDDRNLIVPLSQGRPGIVINFLKHPEKLTEYQERVQRFIEILKSNFQKRWQIINQLMPQGIKFSEFQEDFQDLVFVWNSVIRDLLLIKNHLSSLIVNVFLKEELERLEERYPLVKLKEIFEEIDQTKKYLSWNVNPKLAMENLVLKF